jgi:hypothetical protein
MESMNSSSFLSAFNMALAAVGILIQKGYLTRLGKQQEKLVPKETARKERIYENIPEIPAYQPSELPKINVDTIRHQEKLEERQKLKSYSEKPITNGKSESSTIFFAKDIPEESPFTSLFTSIRYQVKDISYEENKVIISTFSTQVPRILVTFPSPEQTKIIGVSTQKATESFKISINNSGGPKASTWDNPWENIDLSGKKTILEQIKYRTAIANRINEIGFIEINIKGSDDNISYSIIVKKSKPSITAGYSLFIDLVWFFEMLV